MRTFSFNHRFAKQFNHQRQFAFLLFFSPALAQTEIVCQKLRQRLAAALQQEITASGQAGTDRAAWRVEENGSYYLGKPLLTLRQDSQGKVTAGIRQMIQLGKTDELSDAQIFPLS